MRHTVVLEGGGIRLRPADYTDSEFIVKLRTSSHVVGTVGDTSPSIKSQDSWFDAYFLRENDYYFVVETQEGRRIGTYGVYDIKEQSGELGRIVFLPDTPQYVVPAVVLIVDWCFSQLGLTELRGTTVTTNRTVLSLNNRLGFRTIRIQKNAMLIRGESIDLAHTRLKGSEWPNIRNKLLPILKFLDSQLVSKRGVCD
jgi:RimJ/RimL family protein N-acetyltransferase